MSDIPSTNEVEVARIAAALDIAQHLRSADSREAAFEPTLERFLLAYKAIKMAGAQEYEFNIDVDSILKRMKEGR